jgi:cyclopropane fatty-acyl-phospholipid synthase-like methyltransferase
MTDLAGREHWDGEWLARELPAPIDPDLPGAWNEPNRRLHRLVQDAIALGGGRFVTGLEIGCAGSAWLPYLSTVHGLAPTGLDYSALGCRQASEVLHRAGVAGSIVCADLFRPPGMGRSFDLVLSLGVVEHFAATDDCIRAVAAYARPGGVVLTVVPNIAGSRGRLQRWFDRDLYEKHVPLTARRLADAHRAAGLEVERSGYVMSLGANICAFSAAHSTRARRVVKRALDLTSLAVWTLERAVRPLPSLAVTAPYVYVLARCPVDGTTP